MPKGVLASLTDHLPLSSSSSVSETIGPRGTLDPSPHSTPFPLPAGSPLPTRVYSDASSALPHWRAAISAWAATDLSPKHTDHCRRILDGIESGLSVDPTPLPIDKQLPNNSLIDTHADAVRKQLHSYIASGAVEACRRSDITGVHPLLPVVKPDKLRIVVDFSLNLNDGLVVPLMQHSGSVDSAVRLSRPGCYYTKLDIRDCFHSFSVRPGAERLLGFQFEGRYYRFRRLPFGLSTAPELCELMLSVVSWQLRQRGVKHVRYCDDILIVAPTAAECNRMTSIAVQVLDDFGFAVAHHKTIRSVQSVEFLGILLDSIACTVSCPPHRLAELASLLSTAAQHGTRHVVRFVLSLVGKLSFAAQVLPGARPFFRSLIDATKGLHKRAFIILPRSTLEDIAYWQRHLLTWNGRQSWRTPAAPIVIATDASLLGWGGLVLSCPPSIALPPHLSVGSGTAGVWCRSHPVRTSSDIGWAELHAVLFMVSSVGQAAPNSSLTLLVDNQADATIINRQSTRSPALLSLLRAVYSVATDHNLRITARHIPGTSNAAADALSRSLPLPSPLAPISVHCSCEVPKVTVNWSHPSSLYSSDYRCEGPPTRSTSSSWITTVDSVPTPATAAAVPSASFGYARQRSTFARSVRSTHWATTSPPSSGGINPVGWVPYHARASTSGFAPVLSTSTRSSITSSQPSLSPFLKSIPSSIASSSQLSTMRGTGVPPSSASLGYFVSASIAPPLHQPSSFASNMSSSNPLVPASASLFPSRRPTTVPRPSLSAVVQTPSARWPPWKPTSLTFPRTAVQKSHSSSLHVSPSRRSLPTHSANGSRFSQSALGWTPRRSQVTHSAAAAPLLSLLPVYPSLSLPSMVAGNRFVTDDILMSHYLNLLRPQHSSSTPATTTLHRPRPPLLHHSPTILIHSDSHG